MAKTNRSRRLARQSLEELAIRCLQAAVMALIKDAVLDESFDWGRAGDVSVMMARRIRTKAAEVTKDLDGDELAILAEDVLDDASEGPAN